MTRPGSPDPFRVGEANTLTNLGVVQERLGRPDTAVVHNSGVLAIFRGIGERYGQPCVLNGLGRALTGQGAPVDA
ncbi:tetratricopeptide repeat protein [Micromonospora sp. CP22]|uniref:tetratricopeptide repeat protein n=1 Tax=Micromonospora sp. CP22 TaxID=2580517 RepID=UPI0012BCC12F|nr:tetratricopeptide repeat protein [Micromonospora sp. CP22]MTK02416.1 tetratricopeptide repeat protein [Micromonospora sp. CP22]